MYFLGIEAQLNTAKALSYADSRFAHAAILQQITHKNNDLGRLIHNDLGQKRMTIAVIPQLSNKAILRITLFSEYAPQISDYLVNQWERDGKIRFGNVSGEIESFQPVLGVTTWEDFLSPIEISYMRFSFLTPMAIMKSDALGQRYSELQPKARDIFQSLQRKWTTLGGPMMAINFLAKDGELTDIFSACIPASIKIQSEELNMGNYKLLGITGHIVYLFRGQDPVLQTTLNALARFACFSGIGYHTMQGMGAVHTELYREQDENSRR